VVRESFKRDAERYGARVTGRRILPLPRCPVVFKVSFDTEDRARAILAERMAAGRFERRAYQCEFCSQWHLTSQPARSATHV
jgi:hypothetical protein